MRRTLKKIITYSIFLLPVTSFSMELKDLSVEYRKAYGTNRHWNIPYGEKKLGELNLHMRHENNWFYAQESVFTMFTNKQFRYGALEAELGVHTKTYDFFIHHKSEHMLDGRYSNKTYPNQNDIGVRIRLN